MAVPQKKVELWPRLKTWGLRCPSVSTLHCCMSELGDKSRRIKSNLTEKCHLIFLYKLNEHLVSKLNSRENDEHHWRRKKNKNKLDRQKWDPAAGGVSDNHLWIFELGFLCVRVCVCLSGCLLEKCIHLWVHAERIQSSLCICTPELFLWKLFELVSDFL